MNATVNGTTPAIESISKTAVTNVVNRMIAQGGEVIVGKPAVKPVAASTHRAVNLAVQKAVKAIAKKTVKSAAAKPAAKKAAKPTAKKAAKPTAKKATKPIAKKAVKSTATPTERKTSLFSLTAKVKVEDMGDGQRGAIAKILKKKGAATRAQLIEALPDVPPANISWHLSTMIATKLAKKAAQ